MYEASTILAASILCLLQALPGAGQRPSTELPETKVVLRISREFIHELTAKQFSRDVPIDMDFSGTKVTGRARVTGATTVEIQASENSCVFELVVKGEVSTDLKATARAVEAHLRGAAPFQGRRRVIFKDDSFLGQQVQVETSYRSTIERICSLRGGLVGAVTRNLAGATLQDELPEGDRKAGAEVHRRLEAEILKETDGLLASLNKVAAIIKQGEALLREENLLSARSVEHYLAATNRNLYISIGPPNSRIAKLPRLQASERQPIELWVAIQKPGRPARLNPVLANWKLVKPFLLPRITQHSPEAAKILDEVQVRPVDGWYVLTFAPHLLDSL